MKDGADFSRLSSDLWFMDKQTLVGGIFFPQNNIIIVNCNQIKNNKYFKIKLFTLILAELNHYFISINLRKNFQQRYINSITNGSYDKDLWSIHLFDEAITNFYGNYLSFFYFNSYNTQNVCEYFNLNLVIFDYLNDSYLLYEKKYWEKMAKFKNIKDHFLVV